MSSLRQGDDAHVPLGLYLHWPYCARICPYCDFNVVRERGRTAEKAALTRAILADLKAWAALTGPRRLESIFVGGGTPSLMDPDDVARLVETARTHWTPAAECEVTLEANPTDAETGRFAAFAAAGVNRLSLGLQSLDDASLRFLGRDHDAASGRRAAARAAALFPRVSLDLIYALPGQQPRDWSRDLRQAIALGTDHISPYQLTLEPGTAFHRAFARGRLAPPGADLAADLYETTQRVLSEAGFEAYEVSNHARGEAARSRHNLIYWRGQDYLGVGPGAHGRLTIGGERWASETPRGIQDYIAWVARGNFRTDHQRLSAREAALERLVMGLRTDEGVELDALAPLAIDAARIAEFGNLAKVDEGRVRVTARGRPVLDRIVADLAHGA